MSDDALTVTIDRDAYTYGPFGPLSVGCGTYAGVQTHHRRGTPLCRDCRRAHADYVARFRFRKGAQRDPRRCRSCGSVFPEHECGAP